MLVVTCYHLFLFRAGYICPRPHHGHQPPNFSWLTALVGCKSVNVSYFYISICLRLASKCYRYCYISVCLQVNVTGIFIFHYACDWRVNVTGIFLCFSLLTVIFTQLFLCFTIPTWMSTLIYQAQKLSTYIYK